MSRRRLSIVFAALVAILAVGVGKRIAADEQSRASGTTPAAEPFTWKVTLDPAGRPYDVEMYPHAVVERRPLAVLHAPSRRVLFMGGEYLPYPDVTGATRVTLAERPNRRYPVDAIWVKDTKTAADNIVGIVMVERDTPIVRWRELHPVAYGTDGGVGGITTAEWAARPDVEKRRYEKELIDWSGESRASDVDGHDGVDTIAFANGLGDGGFPSVAGYDASGSRAAIVLWTVVVPWRLAFPGGRPPPNVTARENALAACLAGRRKIDGAPCRLSR